jgi:hypothetical protein
MRNVERISNELEITNNTQHNTENTMNILVQATMTELSCELSSLDNEHAQYISYDIDMHMMNAKLIQRAHLLDMIKQYIEHVSPTLSLEIDIEIALLFNELLK